MDTVEDLPTRQFKLKTILECTGVCWAVAAYGYSASIIATTFGQPSFITAMGLDIAPNAPDLMGAANALFFVGGFFGCLQNAALANKFGRKGVIAIGQVILCLSTALLAGSVHIGMFIVFRFTAGFGGYMGLMSAPLWVVEVVPPKGRGPLLDISGIMINLGYVTASWIGVGFFFYQAPHAWRAPLALGCLPSVLCLISLCFVPESPRLLILQGKSEQAWKIISDLHTVHGNDTLARREFEQMNKQIQFESTLKTGWLEIFRRPSYRKRALMTIGLLFTVVSSGALVINNYATIIYGSLGYSPQDQLFLQAGWLTTAFVGNFCAVLIVDRIARPKLISIGLGICLLSLILEASFVATYGTSTNKAGLGSCVAWNYLFVWGFSLFLDGVTWWYAGEIFPTHLRAHGMALGMGTYALTNMVWLQAAPTAFDHIGWKYYLFFIIITFSGMCVVYFTFPDTLHKPLEEVAQLFGDTDLVVAYRQHGLATGRDETQMKRESVELQENELVE
ncbi:hypothetical protein H2204_008712 [Knufia peltigerae]|uniref:Major facilitator superfamily (MFS) profile domain-containing protein n=1 Tax=Knufia peltigerae TaxID=1002370 RepID=A0AA38XZH0_9EURO|nr:hypothetical protein H2204_008712 [Knufia peltigerae]